MPRKRFEWKVRDRALQLGERTLLMGVLNVTPDSFSDGGKFLEPDAAFAHAIAMEDAGADIIDVGAESTKPGSSRISEAEELRRLIPVLKRLKGKLSIPISVDTYKAAVAEKALEHGAEIINDPSALSWDPELARVVSNHNAGLILNHMRGTPETWLRLPPLKNPLPTIVSELEAAVHRATITGLDRKRIMIDPGLGFGKRKEQNAEILMHLDALARMDLPIMVGASRKHFLQKEEASHTEFATAAAVTVSILRGAHAIRVHDVAAMKAVADVADEILRAEVIPTTSDTLDSSASRVVRPGSSAPEPRNLRTPRPPDRRRDVPPGTDTSRPPAPRRDAPSGTDTSRPPDPRHDVPPGTDTSRPPDRRRDVPPGTASSRPPDRRRDGPPGTGASRPPDRRRDGPPGTGASRPPDRRRDGPPGTGSSRPPDRRRDGPPGTGPSRPPRRPYQK